MRTDLMRSSRLQAAKKIRSFSEPFKDLKMSDGILSAFTYSHLSSVIRSASDRSMDRTLIRIHDAVNTGTVFSYHFVIGDHFRHSQMCLIILYDDH